MAASYVRDRVQELASRASADGGVSAAQLVLQLAELEVAFKPLADAAAGCIPGLVAALGSEAEVVWKAALRVLGLAAVSSADSRRAIAASGGVPAAVRLVQAHSSDPCAVQFAGDVLGALALHGAEMSQLIADCGAIPALVAILAACSAADCTTDAVDGFAVALAAVVHDVPSSARQLAAAGGVKPLLRICTFSPARSYTSNAAEKALQGIVDRWDGGWGAVQIAAAQEAQALPPEAQQTLMEVVRRVLPPPAEQQPAARSRRRRQPATPPPQAPDPAEVAAAEAAARAAAEALLQEEQQQVEQQAAKAANKAAKRQRQREQQQAAAAAAAAASAAEGAAHTVEAAAASAAASSAESGQVAEAAAAAASASAAPTVQGGQAAGGEQQAAAGSAGGSDSGGARRSKKQRSKKGKQAAAGSAALAPGEHHAGSSGGTSGAAGQQEAGSSGAVADQQAPAAVQSAAAPAEPDAAELEQLLQQLGLGAAPEDSARSRGRTSTATPEPVSGNPPAALPAAMPASAAADPSPQPFDPSLLSDLCCPITHEPMADPVVAADGGTYERAAIEAWIARQAAAGQAPTSPLTGAPLQDLSLRPNLAVRGMTASLRAAGLLQ